jgi:hypothetical protein
MLKVRGYVGMTRYTGLFAEIAENEFSSTPIGAARL